MSKSSLFLLYIYLFLLYVYLFIYCTTVYCTYIQTMSLACICKNVTNLYFDGFCYSVMYINIHDLHAIFLD